MLFLNKSVHQQFFPKDRIKSRVTLSFKDECTQSSYKTFFNNGILSAHMKIGIFTFGVLLFLLGFVIISGVLLHKKDGYPYKMCYIGVPLLIASTFLWFFLPLRFDNIRGYTGTLPILCWLIFLTEYICHDRVIWAIPPGGIIIFMASIIYGTTLCDLWLKPSISFILGIIYFAIRCLTKLQLVNINKVEFILSMISICFASCYIFYFLDLKYRRDFLEMIDKNEMERFTSFFLEHIPIGVVIYSKKEIQFVNSEFGNIFNIKSTKLPIYKAQNSIADSLKKEVFSKLYNMETNANLLEEIDCDQVTFDNKIYSYENQDIKISPKTTVYYQTTFNILCFFDVTELRKLEKEKIAKKLQTTLMATMSHELRTPLNGIIGSIKSIKDLDCTKSYRKELTTIDSCSSILLMKVNDMLDFAQLELSNIKIYLSKTNIKELLACSYSHFESLAQAKLLLFELNISNTLPSIVIIDEKRVNQIVYNIIENALKFTSKGKVSVNCNSIGDTVLQISIIDTGSGISKDKQEKLFKIFENDKNYKSSGIGLGLYVSKMLAIKMGGDISFSSNEKVGSTFTLSVPFKVGFSSDISLMTKEGLALDECCPKVLIVDDNNFNLEVLESMLRKLNISCDKAMNGQIALDKLVQCQQRKCCSPYQLILMDCNMPVLDGYEATIEIIKMIKLNTIASTTVIGVTAYTSTEHLDNCIKSGMKNAICKPVKFEELRDILIKHGLIS